MITNPDIKKKILFAKKILKTNKLRFIDSEGSLTANCYSLYVSTNENLNYYLRLPSFKGKDILVPTASGDHALNAIYLGAKSVETFDINSLAMLNYDLKETAVKYLTREEYLQFYSIPTFFDEDLYIKIREHLKPETRMFYDSIYSYLDTLPDDQLNSEKLGNLIEEINLQKRENLIANNPFLKSDRSYKTLQDRLFKLSKPVKHKLCSAHELNSEFKDKDIVILSNILRYYLYEEYTDIDYAMDTDMAEKIKASISDVLKNDGIASLLYIYALKSRDKKWFLEENLEKSLDLTEVSPLFVKHNLKENAEDKIILVQKDGEKFKPLEQGLESEIEPRSL